MANITYFYFMLFENLGYIKYALFSLGFILYCAIIVCNALVILAVYLERTMHQPMYLLISCLSINSVYGTAGFFPRVLADLLSDTHIIASEACLLQTYVIYSYTGNEMIIIMLMSLDRFVAISKPLQYHSLITPKVLTVLLVIFCIYLIITLGTVVIVTAKLTMCGNQLWKVYCHNYEIVKLSCEKSFIINILSMFILVTMAFIPLSFILYSYIKILIICQKSSAQFKSKAYQTCIPHIVVLLNFSVALITEVILSRVVNLEIPMGLTIALSLEFIIVPPILNPIVYALNMPDIRKKIVCLLKSSK
ncbi:olfactory receptor 6K3-like [Xyrauchen texanus]|uniref:olfactory receptor 6K3-like n=1 Tax=Xyrauchen texanus TaxID=154827 RepID=UPI00224251FB|nr:olfactory receptor 6K3-like [Xyrauchen texanus]